MFAVCLCLAEIIFVFQMLLFPFEFLVISSLCIAGNCFRGPGGGGSQTGPRLTIYFREVSLLFYADLSYRQADPVARPT